MKMTRIPPQTQPKPAGAGRAVPDETGTFPSPILRVKSLELCSGSSVFQLGWRAVAVAMPEIAPVPWESLMLVVTRKVGEKILVGNVMITITRSGKSSVRIGIDAPDDVLITRQAASHDITPSKYVRPVLRHTLNEAN